MAKRGKERENHKTTSQTQMSKKMENKEDAIEVNKISRHQMRRLKAKEKKVKPLSRKIYLKFYNK